VPVLRQLIEDIMRLVGHDFAFCRGAADGCAAAVWTRSIAYAESRLRLEYVTVTYTASGSMLPPGPNHAKQCKA
jgi:hypothetical protein